LIALGLELKKVLLENYEIKEDILEEINIE
jgi:hypothetical protein